MRATPDGGTPAGPDRPYPPVIDAAEADDVTVAADVEATADALAVDSDAGVEAVVGRWQTPGGRLLRTALALIGFFLIVGVAWELFKWLFGDPWRLQGILGTSLAYEHVPPFKLLQASDLQLPHLWSIAAKLLGPVQRSQEQTLAAYLVGAAVYTLAEAAIGFVLGSAIGIALASVFVHSRLAERALIPYVIVSQTIPIVALAPIIVVSFGRGLTSVVIISTYLTFFPVTIAMVRGLRSPDPRALELMRSYAASRWAIYRKVRLPASVPYLFTALKIAAAASVVGAIIGEAPGGVKEGLGRALVNFNQQYITGPEKLWGTILIASLAGIAFYVLVRVVELIALRDRGRMEA